MRPTTNKRCVVTITMSFNVDADALDLLPGWPGSTSPTDPTDCDPPISGARLLLDDLGRRAVDAFDELWPTVVDPIWMGNETDIGPAYDADRITP